MTKTVQVWTPLGDLPLNSAMAGQVGTSFGNGAAGGSSPQNPNQMGTAGSLSEVISSTGISPSATGLDKIVAIMTIPAGALDVATRGVNIVAAGSGGNTNAKTIKIILNPTNAAPILTNGTVTVTGGSTLASMTSSASGGWIIEGSLFKFGATGSNTQIGLMTNAQGGATPLALTAPVTNLTLPENAPILVAITANAATATGDVVFNFGQLFAMN
jgi:hypothetical protein